MRETVSIGRTVAITLVIILLVAARSFAGGAGEADVDASSVEPDAIPAGARTAVFAGGCFWCMEEAYEKVPGVYEAVSGFAGGDVADPGYYEVVGGGTGHTEVVRVYYDPQAIGYEELLHVFWRNVDPIDAGGQFCDRGQAYRTGIFYESEEERRLAEESKREIEESGRFNQPIVTAIEPLDVIEGDDNDGFWRAEENHQDYYRKNPLQYSFYKEGCGRVRRLEQLWGDEAGAPSMQKQG